MEAEEYHRREKKARLALLGEVDKGSQVVVVAGRKLPIGTRGTVMWLGNGEFGTRVGILTPGADNLVYTALRNVEAVYPGLPTGMSPAGGWQWLYEYIKSPLRHLPRKGHKVRRRSDGSEGVVFWTDAHRSRLGYKGADNEAVWADASAVDHLLDTEGPTPYEPAFIPVIPQRSHSDWKRLLADYPAPFCDIRSFEWGDGSWQEIDWKGNRVCTLPFSAISQLPSESR